LEPKAAAAALESLFLPAAALLRPFLPLALQPNLDILMIVTK